jgi:hypothetical protein
MKWIKMFAQEYSQVVLSIKANNSCLSSFFNKKCYHTQISMVPAVHYKPSFLYITKKRSMALNNFY